MGGVNRVCVEVGGGGWRQGCLLWHFCLSYLHFLLRAFLLSERLKFKPFWCEPKPPVGVGTCAQPVPQVQAVVTAGLSRGFCSRQLLCGGVWFSWDVDPGQSRLLRLLGDVGTSRSADLQWCSRRLEVTFLKLSVDVSGQRGLTSRCLVEAVLCGSLEDG